MVISMDKIAKKILFNTYWSSKGWKDALERQTSQEDFEYAKEKGLMFDRLTISHDECVKRVVKLADIITQEQVAKAFLCSLSTRRLDWRSAVSSYYIAKLFTEHKYSPEGYGGLIEDGVIINRSHTCGVCKNLMYGVIGQENYINEDLNVMNFERIKWGGVSHGELLYTWFDLEQFSKEEIPEPANEDIEIFKGILAVIESCEATDYPSALRARLKGLDILKANKAERDVIIEILACIGILNPKSYDRKEAGKHDWTYATYWRGEDGYDKEVVDKYFGKYL